MRTIIRLENTYALEIRNNMKFWKLRLKYDRNWKNQALRPEKKRENKIKVFQQLYIISAHMNRISRPVRILLLSKIKEVLYYTWHQNIFNLRVQPCRGVRSKFLRFL